MRNKRLDPSKTIRERATWKKAITNMFTVWLRDAKKWLEEHSVTFEGANIRIVKPDALQAKPEGKKPLSNVTVRQHEAEMERLFNEWNAKYAKSVENALGAVAEQMVESAYRKGRKRSFTETASKRKGTSRDMTRQAEQVEEFTRQLTTKPTKLLSQLKTRAKREVKISVTRVQQSLDNALGRGLSEALSNAKIGKNFAKFIRAGAGFAVTAAQTELTRAQAEGQLEALEELGEYDVTALVEWVTQRDDKVCPECYAMEGVIYTVADAKGVLPLHPNCRCAWLPVEKGLSKKETKERMWYNQ